jgi:hypothetical protein
MTTTTVFGAGVKANPRFGRLRWALAHVFPSLGTPFHMEAVLYGPDGRVKVCRRVWNTVTTAGKNGTADQILAAPTLGKPTHMAVGTGSPSGTALGTELDRNALTSKTRAAAVVTMVGDWAAGDGTGAITEAGVFDASSTGNMWLSTTFSVINKGASDVLSISWTLTIS